VEEQLKESGVRRAEGIGMPDEGENDPFPAHSLESVPWGAAPLYRKTSSVCGSGVPAAIISRQDGAHTDKLKIPCRKRRGKRSLLRFNLLERRASMRGHHATIPMVILILLGCLFAADPAFAAPTVVNVKVATSADDAEENHLGAVTLAEPTLDIGGAYRTLGLRFAGINVPRYAKITTAYIEFTADAGDSGAAVYKIAGQASDNPATFTTANFNLSTRSTYAPAVNWSPGAWSSGSVYQTAEIKDIVQTLVNRQNWNPGNAMAFVIQGTEEVFRRAKSYDKGASTAPSLHIEWEGSVLEVRVNLSTDDMYQFGTSSVYNATTLYLAFSNTSYCAGLRFQNVNIPQGAPIIKAWLDFKAAASAATGTSTASVTIRGEKRLDPPTFSTTSSSVDSVGSRKSTKQTSALVTWNNIPAWTASQQYQSADIRDIVQELVGQTGWGTSSKAMAFFLSGNETRRAVPFDSSATSAPLLHIEYLDPAAPGGGAPVMVVNPSSLNPACSPGETAVSRVFELENQGAGDLTYTTTIVYQSGAGWLNIVPAPGTAFLNAGAKQFFMANFNTASLAAGTYAATINIQSTGSPAPNPGLREVVVNLSVGSLPPPVSCGDTPFDARETESPAVLILLDLSQSMFEKVAKLPVGTVLPQTPEIKTLVQEVVNQAGWSSGNAMAFYLERVSGSSQRYFWSYDGLSGWAALLHIEYTEPDGTGPKTLTRRVFQANDDADGRTGGWGTLWQECGIGFSGSGRGAALRFQDISIPFNSSISKAYIEVVPSQTKTGTLNIKIRGEKSLNAMEFNAASNAILSRPKTTAEVSWPVPDWSGIIPQTKMDIAKEVISDLVKDTGISWGFGTWAEFAPYPEAVGEKTYTIVDVGCKANTAAHQNNLQAAISATTHQSGSNTPFWPSILGARKYFAGEKADKAGAFFTATACQPKVVIHVTDGKGNVPAATPEEYLSSVVQQVNALLGSGVSAVGVGFGIGPEGDVRAQLQSYAKLANEKGEQDPNDMVYPIHMTESGLVTPYWAGDKLQLKSALTTIVGAIKTGMFYSSAPAAFSSTDLGSRVLVSSYNSTDWSGDLVAVGKDAGGKWKSVLWEASKNTAGRNIWTVDSANQVVAYAGYNFFCKPIGDIINSSPVVVGAPPFFYRFDNYNTFKINRTVSVPRDTMIYVGANDGLVHAVRLSDGVAKWAFLPKSVREKLELAADPSLHDRCSPNYCHSYHLDGSPKVADVYANFGSVNKQWRTILVIGKRSGGDTYTALDVTDGKDFDPTPPYEPYRATYLWEFIDPDLGETWSDPSIERVNATSTSCLNTGAAWGVFFGSGPAVVDSQQATKRAYLYGIKADDASALWKSATSVPVNKWELLASGLRQNNVAGSPVVVDLMDPNTDWASYPAACQRHRVYVGDSYGTMYRHTKVGPGETPHQTRLFQFNPLPATADLTPIRGRPTYAFSADKTVVWLYYGTGRYEVEADKSTTAQQYFFGLKDLASGSFVNTAATYAQDATSLATLQTAIQAVPIGAGTKTIRTLSGTNADGKSWALKLFKPATGGSERSFTKPLVVGGIVFFTTFIPEAGGCGGSGDTYVFALDYKTGLPPSKPVFDLNGDKKFTDADKVTISGNKVVPAGVYVGKGQGSAPVLFKNTIFITTTLAQSQSAGEGSGGLHALAVNIPDNKVRMESWRHN
jgi:hypothetical protein